MNIIEATEKAMKVGKGIINKKWTIQRYYLLPTNTAECYLVIPKGFNIESVNACPRWNPNANDILSDNWEIYDDVSTD